MRNESIKIGDWVVVIFNNAQVTLNDKTQVKWIPCATGDSWHFEDETGLVQYVSEGCTITKFRSQGEPNGTA